MTTSRCVQTGTVLAVLLISTLATKSVSRTWLVKPDGTGDAPTIQAGIDSASTADTLLLASGLFTGPGNHDIDFKEKALVLTSLEGRDSTIIDCQYSGRAFYIHSTASPPTEISRISVRKGTKDYAYGCGIFIDSATVKIIDVSIEDCQSEWASGGGGIAISNSYATIRRTKIDDNFCPIGPGGGIWASHSTVLVDSSEVTRNYTLDDGGGIYLNSCDTKIQNTLIDHNGTGNGCCGGGISRTHGSLVVIHSTISYNASYNGAGIFGDVDTLLSNIFERNSYVDYYGQGVAFMGDATYVANNIFRDNLGDDIGSTIYGSIETLTCNLFVDNVNDVSIIEGAVRLMENNTFVLSSGWNTHFLFTDTTVARNNIFYDVTSAIPIFSSSSQGIAKVSCSDIYTELGTPGFGDVVDAGGNIFSNPFFCDAANGNFMLSAFSDCMPGNNSCSVVMGTYPQGCEEPVGVDSDKPTVQSLRLMQNYPNPFNPRTTITYSLPETGTVLLSIYDVQGRLIAILVNGQKAAGEHQESWNGRDRNGITISSGIYFLKLEFRGQTQTRKMVMLK